MRTLERHFALLDSHLEELRLVNHDRARHNVSYLLEAEPELLNQVMEMCGETHDYWGLWRDRFDSFTFLNDPKTAVPEIKRIMALADTAILIRSVTARNQNSPAELVLLMTDPVLKSMAPRRDPGYKMTQALMLFIAMWDQVDEDWALEDTSYQSSIQLISENLQFFHEHFANLLNLGIRRFGEISAYCSVGASPLNQGSL